MIEFKTNVQEVLPYDRKKYIEFLGDEFEGDTEWRGVSIQWFNQKQKMDIEKFIEIYSLVFQSVLSDYEPNSCWVVNHKDKYLNWFPNENNNLEKLRNQFKQKNISNTFKGALVFEKQHLIEFSNELLSYPFIVMNEKGLLYKNLDVSNRNQSFIIKITGHGTLDILSTDKNLLKQIFDNNLSSNLKVKLYNGTSL